MFDVTSFDIEISFVGKAGVWFLVVVRDELSGVSVLAGEVFLEFARDRLFGALELSGLFSATFSVLVGVDFFVFPRQPLSDSSNLVDEEFLEIARDRFLGVLGLSDLLFWFRSVSAGVDILVEARDFLSGVLELAVLARGAFPVFTRESLSGVSNFADEEFLETARDDLVGSALELSGLFFTGEEVLDIFSGGEMA